MAVEAQKPKKKVRRGGVKHKSKALPQNPTVDDSEMVLEPLDSESAEPLTASAPEERWEGGEEGDDEVMIDNDAVALPQDAPAFPPLSAGAQRAPTKSEIRRIPIPPHRLTPLKKDWVNIFSPLAELCGLQVRMNTQRRAVEIRVRIYLLFILSLTKWVAKLQTSKHSKEVSFLQKGADFVKAYALGFDVNVCLVIFHNPCDD